MFLDHANEIVLVISDVVMPQMDGIELAARSRLERRRIKLILMTGYAAATLTSGIGGAIPLLRKPFLPGRTSANRTVGAQWLNFAQSARS